MVACYTWYPPYDTYTLTCFFLAVNQDFTAPSLDIYFPTNSADSAVLPLTFNITDDMIFEKDETFQLQIVEAEDNVNIDSTPAVVTIVDDESKYCISSPPLNTTWHCLTPLDTLNTT